MCYSQVWTAVLVWSGHREHLIVKFSSVYPFLTEQSVRSSRCSKWKPSEVLLIVLLACRIFTPARLITTFTCCILLTVNWPTHPVSNLDCVQTNRFRILHLFLYQSIEKNVCSSWYLEFMKFGKLLDRLWWDSKVHFHIQSWYANEANETRDRITV